MEPATTNLIAALAALAERESYSPTFHWGGKDEHLALRLDDDGKVLRIEERKECPVRHPWSAPRTSGYVANVGFDKAKYLFRGFEDEKAEKCHAASAALHEELHRLAPRHRGVRAIGKFFDRRTKVPKKYADQEDTEFLFYYRDEKRPVFEDPRLHDVIGQLLIEQFETAPYPSLFEEGDVDAVISVHAKVKLPGLEKAQALVTYNDAENRILHDKRHRMLHAPMSYRLMRAHLAGLDWLTSHASLPVAPTTTPLAYFAWTEKRHRFEGVVRQVLRGAPKNTSNVAWLRWVREHLDEDLGLWEDETTLYALGCQVSKRIAVRTFLPLTVRTAALHLRSFLDDYEWQRQRLGAGVRRVLSVINKKKDTKASKKDDKKKESKMAVGIVEGLYDSIFQGRRLPVEFYFRALPQYLEADRSTNKQQQFDQPLYAATLACVQRRTTVNHHLPLEKRASYQCGVLFAICEIRNMAVKDRGDQPTFNLNFDDAMRSPAHWFPPILALSERHLQKARKMGRRTFAMEMNEAVLAITEAGGFPKKLTPMEQCEFIQGRVRAHTDRRNQEYQDQWKRRVPVYDLSEFQVGDLFFVGERFYQFTGWKEGKVNDCLCWKHGEFALADLKTEGGHHLRVPKKKPKGGGEEQREDVDVEDDGDGV